MQGSWIGASALNLSSESDEQKVKHFDEGSSRVQSCDDAPAVGGGQQSTGGWVKVAVVKSWRNGKSRARKRPSWNFVDDGDPVITAAAATERHENDLVQWQ